MSQPILRRNARGDSVTNLQRLLADAGYNPGPLDGAFGGGTEAAVRVFQAAQGLDADGVVGPATWRLLEAATSGSARPPATTVDSEPIAWSTVPGTERMRYVMTMLVDTYGYPVNGAAGIVGNLWAESGVIPNRVEGSSSTAPMRARGFSGAQRDFTPEEIMDRSVSSGVGPALPGVGLAQWTSSGRRSALFAHVMGGRRLGASILFDMDAQVDFLHQELTSSYSRVQAVVSRAGVTVEEACDEAVYNFEVPGSVLDGGSKLPRSDPRVQAVFRERRSHADKALRAYQSLEAGAPPVSSGAITGGGTRPVLRQGDRGEAVTDLQRQLTTAGADPGPADGMFGNKTATAVKWFQHQRGLSADGVVGPQTWDALEKQDVTAVDILWPDVPLLPQTTSSNCWAAAAGMVASWDREQTVDYVQAPTPTEIEDAAAWFDLELEPLVSLTPEALKNLLETKGPLWICANQPFEPGPGFHAVVVTGMFGEVDESGSSLCLYVLDPWDRGHSSPCMPAPHSGTHERGSRYSITYPQHIAELEAAVSNHEGWRWVRIMHARETEGRRAASGATVAPVD
jgi:peptidoglycan hydrolase-like protein with peptidoglycan-binding domain